MSSGSWVSSASGNVDDSTCLAQHDGDLDAEIALPHLRQALAGFDRHHQGAHDAVVGFGQNRRRADAAQAVVRAPDVVREIAAQGVRHDLGAGQRFAELAFVVAHPRHHPALGVDRDDRFDADALPVGDQLAQTVAQRIVQEAQITRAARGRVQRVDDLAVGAELGHVVDPAPGVVLQHLLGGVLRRDPCAGLRAARCGDRPGAAPRRRR